ncbi:acetyltransferase [Erwinia phage vB_EamM_Caitlin]|uniref:acetyltransferase n=1 Tax=Erwinia phage vB_EamM_Caitlin TaxID=1883379 RepID=UPI00081C2FC9|nr:acetyltransferase [Erwinia phage vB_EamM_Caitlin]ANZ48392.1 putative acetyltransferase [Erwinia phage vB_EamM_Caitlin]
MLIISVSVDKISPETYPGLRSWIEELNAIRATPVNIVMAVEDDNVMGIMVWEPGHLIYLVVPEVSRECGAGRFLVKYLLQQSEGNVAWCKVLPTAVDAICFFHKLGWQIQSWYTDHADRRYFRMTNAVPQSSTIPSEETHLEAFASSVPIFLSMAGGIY